SRLMRELRPSSASIGGLLPHAVEIFPIDEGIATSIFCFASGISLTVVEIFPTFEGIAIRQYILVLDILFFLLWKFSRLIREL
ncbi:hypothetical protein, partial [Persephonella sp.]